MSNSISKNGSTMTINHNMTYLDDDGVMKQLPEKVNVYDFESDTLRKMPYTEVLSKKMTLRREYKGVIKNGKLVGMESKLPESLVWFDCRQMKSGVKQKIAKQMLEKKG